MGNTIVIYFSGMDGSGKTTLSTYLHDALKERNFAVELVWWLECEDSALRRLMRRIGRSSLLKFKANRNSSNAAAQKEEFRLMNKLFRVVYPRLVLFDYLIFGIKKVSIPKIMGKEKILIFDRYIYDVIFSLSDEFDFPAAKKNTFWRYGKILPGPDRVFFIEVSPEISFLRKKEELRSIEQAEALWQKHQALLHAVENFLPEKARIIDNIRDIEVAKKEILEQALNTVDSLF